MTETKRQHGRSSTWDDDPNGWQYYNNNYYFCPHSYSRSDNDHHHIDDCHRSLPTTASTTMTTTTSGTLTTHNPATGNHCLPFSSPSRNRWIPSLSLIHHHQQQRRRLASPFRLVRTHNDSVMTKLVAVQRFAMMSLVVMALISMTSSAWHLQDTIGPSLRLGKEEDDAASKTLRSMPFQTFPNHQSMDDTERKNVVQDATMVPVLEPGSYPRRLVYLTEQFQQAWQDGSRADIQTPQLPLAYLRQLHHHHDNVTGQLEIQSVYPMRQRQDNSALNDDETTTRSRYLDQTRLYGGNTGLDSNDFVGMERRRWPLHEDDPDHCHPMHSWQSMSFPVCNTIHEQEPLGVALSSAKMSLLSSKGFWRHAWKQQESQSSWPVDTNGTLHEGMTNTVTETKTSVWRTFKLEHDMEEAFFENARVDALAMERLTGSPYVIDMYAFCGMTVVTEFAGEELATVANKLNSTERLRLATKVAKGLADIHTIDGPNNPPSLVHNDVNLGNLIFTEDHRPVFNDFNIAILQMTHNETGETCKFASHFPNPQWRAPEEQVYSEDESDKKPPRVTDKVDIYALGNVFYRLAVEASPWKKPGAKKLSPDEKMQVAKAKRIAGEMPHVPEETEETTDPALQVLLQAMRMAYRFDPSERPTATEIHGFLVKSLERIELEEMYHVFNDNLIDAMSLI